MLVRKKMYSVQIPFEGKFIQARAFLKLRDAKKYAQNFIDFTIVQKTLLTII